MKVRKTVTVKQETWQQFSKLCNSHKTTKLNCINWLLSEVLINEELRNRMYQDIKDIEDARGKGNIGNPSGKSGKYKRS